MAECKAETAAWPVIGSTTGASLSEGEPSVDPEFESVTSSKGEEESLSVGAGVGEREEEELAVGEQAIKAKAEARRSRLFFFMLFSFR